MLIGIGSFEDLKIFIDLVDFVMLLSTGQRLSFLNN